MYESYFKLTVKPFDLLPDPDFLFMGKSHKRALSYLDYGVQERAGFILLTGEVGSGKTTIIRNLLRKQLNNVVISKLFNTRVDSEQLIAMVNDDFGLPAQGRDKIVLLRELNDFLIEQFVKGNKPVLIIDEAQNLAPELLEEIRMLSNLETDQAKLLQIILVGQPELRDTLASPALVQLRQRISINCHLHPLTRSETEQYILHRLEKAGNRSAVSFSETALDIIFRYSRGIPRLINIICDFLMLSAFAEETTTIDIEMVKDIVGDLDFDHHFWGNQSAKGQISASTGNGFAAGTEADGKEFSSLIRDLNERLDNLGKESAAFNQSLIQEMAARITDLEQSLNSHREATDSLISDMQRNLEMPGNGDKGGESIDGEDKNVKGNFIKRMLRA